MTTRKRPNPKTYPPLTQSTTDNQPTWPLRRLLQIHAHIARGHINELEKEIAVILTLVDPLEPHEMAPRRPQREL